MGSQFMFFYTLDKAGMMIALNIMWIVNPALYQQCEGKGKGFRTIALGSMPQVLCYPRKETVKVTATKLVSVTLSGPPETDKKTKTQPIDETGLVTVTL